MAKFSIGEIAIFIADEYSAKTDHEFSGEDVEITGMPEIREHYGNISIGPAYQVKVLSTGMIGYATEACLRKKKFDRGDMDEKTTWQHIYEITGGDDGGYIPDPEKTK